VGLLLGNDVEGHRLIGATRRLALSDNYTSVSALEVESIPKLGGSTLATTGSSGDNDRSNTWTFIGFVTVSGSMGCCLQVSLPKSTALNDGIELGDQPRVEHNPVTGEFVYVPVVGCPRIPSSAPTRVSDFLHITVMVIYSAPFRT